VVGRRPDLDPCPRGAPPPASGPPTTARRRPHADRICDGTPGVHVAEHAVPRLPADPHGPFSFCSRLTRPVRRSSLPAPQTCSNPSTASGLRRPSARRPRRVAVPAWVAGIRLLLPAPNPKISAFEEPRCCPDAGGPTQATAHRRLAATRPAKLRESDAPVRGRATRHKVRPESFTAPSSPNLGRRYASINVRQGAPILYAYAASCSRVAPTLRGHPLRASMSAEVLDVRMSRCTRRWMSAGVVRALLRSERLRGRNRGHPRGALTPVERCADVNLLRAVSSAP